MKELVHKVIRMRKAMLRIGVCSINPHKMAAAIQLFQTYGDIYPKASNKGYKAMVKNHFQDFMLLMPRKGHAAYKKLHTELNIHLNT